MEVKPGRMFIGRLEKGAELLSALTELCKKEDIRLGVLTLIGSVTEIRAGYYNQVTKKYIENLRLEERWEIVSCLGNISHKDADISIHAHIVFSDGQGQCFGGHLLPGTEVFAAEYYIRELTGTQLVRQPDADTGLSLWL